MLFSSRPNSRSLKSQQLKRSGAASRRRLFAEGLEDRRLLAGIPGVTFDGPTDVMIGELVQASVNFDNLDAADPGFGPFVDVYVPRTGADGAGAASDDGLIYQVGSANFLGASIVTTQLTFPNNGGGVGTVAHPYAVDNTGAALQVRGIAGDQLLVFELPFGSFTADQPVATIDFDVLVSPDADLSNPLALRSRAGFRYGNDALNNPNTDPTILSEASADATTWTQQFVVAPEVIDIEKTYIGPEDETATGPNFVRQYRIDVDIADGQTVTDLDIFDALPNNIELISVVSITPAGSTTTFPTTPANAPNNLLSVRIPTVTGSTATNDATLIFDYFVPFRDADAATVIDVVSGDDTLSENTAFASANWVPTDTRDSASVATADPAGFEHVLTPKSIATQKSVSITNDVGGAGYTSGDTVEYTINFQISDFFAFSGVTLNDVLSDGQRFDGTFTPTLTFREHGVTSSAAFNVANFTVTDNFSGAGAADGTQEIDFAISDELVTRALDGILLGGLIPPTTGTTGPDPDSANFDLGATTGTIVFRAVVQDVFTDDFPSGDASVDEGDELTNSITIGGDVHRYDDLSLTGQAETDGSATSFEIESGTLSKSVYAINGNTTLPSPLQLAPGDQITYRLQTTIPSSDVENLALEDFLPLPVLFATEVTTFNDVISGTPPAAGAAQFGPADSFRALYGTTPTLTANAGSNSLLFDYGDFDDPANSASQIDILFTVTASDEPFANGLFLTNQVRRTQDSTNNANFVNDAIIQIEMTEPELRIRKGVVATDNPNALFSPATVGPVAFSAPGTPGFRGSATIDSDGLAASPINSNLSRLDADDLVTFAIVIENTGESRYGAFDVSLRDTLPAGFSIPTAGLNLTISDGAGAAMPFTTVGTGLFDPAGGIILNDPGTTPDTGDGTNSAAIDPYDPNDGQNILIVTYDLQVDSDATPLESLNNTATLFNYASTEGGPDFTTVDQVDGATAQIQAVTVAKTITGTNQTHTPGNNVAIGEIVTYRSTITVPEGISPNFTWVDTPDAGLAIVDILSVTGSGSLTAANGTFSAIQAAGTVAAQGASATLSFGDLTNVDTDNLTAETIIVDYRVVVLNTTGNDAGDQLNNLATVSWTGGSRTGSAPQATVVEPLLQVDVTDATPAAADAGDVVSFTVNLAHAAGSTANAFDVNLDNLINSVSNHLQYVPASVSFTSTGATLASSGDTGGDLSASWLSFPLGATATITFDALIQNSAPAGAALTNSATVLWTSLPGDVTSPQSSNDVSVERTGATTDPGDTANDHVSSDPGVVNTFPPTGSKTIVSTSLPSSGSGEHDPGREDLLVGEEITYSIIAVLPEGTNTLDITDQLPVGATQMEVVSAQVNRIGSQLTASSPSVTISDSDSDTVDDRVVFSFASILNTPDGVSNANDEIEVLVTARLIDALGNANGVVLTNTAAINLSGSVSNESAEIEVIEPVLDIDKATTTPNGPPGTTVPYTVTIEHSGTSTATAYDLALSDLFSDPNLTLVPGTVATDRGTITSGNSAGDSNIGLSLATLNRGESITLSFEAIVNPSVAGSTLVTNTASLQYDHIPGPGGRVATNDDSETFTTTTPIADVSITIDDNIDPIAINGQLRYTLLVSNVGPSTATNVTLNHPLPAGVSAVTASSGQGSVSATSTLVAGNLGTLLPGQSTTIIVDLTVPGTPGTISSSPTVSIDQTDSVPSNNIDTEPTLIVALSSLAGTSWVDINSNGVVDSGEILLPGVVLTLNGIDDLGAPVTRTTTTDPSGNYLFDLLRPGSYEVIQSQPSIFVDNLDYLGSASGALSDDLYSVTLAAGVDGVGYNFTELGLSPVAFSKRSLLNSRLNPSTFGAMSFDLFVNIMTPRGQADLNNDTVVDGLDYNIFLGSLGAPF